MTFCCLVPATGPDRFIAINHPRSTITHCGDTYHRTGQSTHGGWPIYRSALTQQAKGEGGGGNG